MVHGVVRSIITQPGFFLGGGWGGGGHPPPLEDFVPPLGDPKINVLHGFLFLSSPDPH